MMSWDEEMRQMELFAEHIIPAFRGGRCRPTAEWHRTFENSQDKMITVAELPRALERGTGESFRRVITSASCCAARIITVPTRSGGGRLTDRTSAVQPRRRELVLMPLS